MRLRLAALVLTLVASDAAARPRPDTVDERPLETATGRGRLFAPVSWRTPARARRPWHALAATGAWQAMWDVDRGVPIRVFGEGLPAPGSVDDPAAAERSARDALAAHLELLAPGAAPADFTLVANSLARGLRTVGFAQTYRGLPVLGGQVSFLFEHDRLVVMSSAAAPDVDVAIPPRMIDGATARAAAVGWIAGAYGGAPAVLGQSGTAILPIVRDHADGVPPLEYRVVSRVTVDLAAPRGRWEVYVDAASGRAVARTQLLRFGAGTLRYNAPVRGPAGTRMDYPADRVGLTASAQSTTTDAAGGFAYTGAGPATVVTSLAGPLVQITNDAGVPATTNLSIPDGQIGTWDARAVDTDDAQLSGFVHASLVKAFARGELAPTLAWLDTTLHVQVNELGQCNAYSTGDTIHFVAAGAMCVNTAQVADAVYHEFGHSLHLYSIVQGAGAYDLHLSEGVSDYLAATMTGDPGICRGIYVGNDNPLRDIDPAGREYAFPADMSSDPHLSGLIISGALWDLRTDLMTSLGAVAGKHKADDLYYAVLRRASDIPSTYVEVLAADDDDGNLANGTPDKCAIDRSFAPHGLVDPAIGLGITPPTHDGLAVTLAIADPPGGCPAAVIDSVVLDWQRRGDTATQSIAMTHAGAAYTASIPEQADGTVVEYEVTVTLGGGLTLHFPDNPADPMYDLYVGPVIPLYCTDFERDPAGDGWVHAATGAPDDWEWGVPQGDAPSGDPGVAASGTRVIGNDLGTAGRDGRYSPGTSTTLASPIVDTRGMPGVRLQYKRWLTVEDGFYDDATILANDQAVWSNYASTDESAATVDHRDREWRFHDVDLAAQADLGSVQVKFRLESDQDQELGGWNLDDFCIVARGVPGCGNGVVDPGEECDDGNLTGGDGCSSICKDEHTMPPPDGGCCQTGQRPTGPLALGILSGFAMLRRRRRKGGTCRRGATL